MTLAQAREMLQWTADMTGAEIALATWLADVERRLVEMEERSKHEDRCGNRGASKGDPSW